MKESLEQVDMSINHNSKGMTYCIIWALRWDHRKTRVKTWLGENMHSVPYLKRICVKNVQRRLDS